MYCHPKHYRGLANALYRNRHDGTFEDVTAKSGIGAQVGKGMSVAFADYDGDGFTDIFVTNDAVPDFLFHNRGNGTFEEVGLLAGVAVPAHGRPVSSMGTDFRDVDNDGWPDIVLTALNGETFPFFKNDGGKFFHDATYPSGLGAGSVRMAGWGAAFVDLDNDGFKDLVTANSHANDRIEEFESRATVRPTASSGTTPATSRTSPPSRGRTSRWRAPTGASASAISTETAGSISSSRCSATARNCCATSALRQAQGRRPATGSPCDWSARRAAATASSPA